MGIIAGYLKTRPRLVGLVSRGDMGLGDYSVEQQGYWSGVPNGYSGFSQDIITVYLIVMEEWA